MDASAGNALMCSLCWHCRLPLSCPKLCSLQHSVPIKLLGLWCDADVCILWHAAELCDYSVCALHTALLIQLCVMQTKLAAVHAQSGASSAEGSLWYVRLVLIAIFQGSKLFAACMAVFYFLHVAADWHRHSSSMTAEHPSKPILQQAKTALAMIIAQHKAEFKRRDWALMAFTALELMVWGPKLLSRPLKPIFITHHGLTDASALMATVVGYILAYAGLCC